MKKMLAEFRAHSQCQVAPMSVPRPCEKRASQCPQAGELKTYGDEAAVASCVDLRFGKFSALRESHGNSCDIWGTTVALLHSTVYNLTHLNYVHYYGVFCLK